MKYYGIGILASIPDDQSVGDYVVNLPKMGERQVYGVFTFEDKPSSHQARNGFETIALAIDRQVDEGAFNDAEGASG